MKTKEEVLIKLGEQSKKVNVELAILNDIDSFIDSANKKLASANDKVKSAILEYTLAKSASSKAMDLSKDAIQKAKELGVDTKMFDGRYSMAKYSFDVASKNENIKISF